MTRDIAIPPYFVPGTTQIAPTTVTFELVNALGQPITGLTSAYGIAGVKKVVATDTEQIIALDINDDIAPFSQWLTTTYTITTRRLPVADYRYQRPDQAGGGGNAGG